MVKYMGDPKQIAIVFKPYFSDSLDMWKYHFQNLPKYI